MVCFITWNYICISCVTKRVLANKKEVEPAMYLSVFFCLHVNCDSSGFKALQTSMRSMLSEKFFITSRDFW